MNLLSLVIVCLLAGCNDSKSPPELSHSDVPGVPEAAADSTALSDEKRGGSAKAELPARLTSHRLPNLVRVHEKVISGGLPEGDAAFHELADLGVKTIISVDGMTPDVSAAAKHGLRYVHLPHGYDGIPEQRVKELAIAVHELEGPIYIHCHHGKHRSPAAASVACVSAGLIAADQAVSILELAGTNPGYRGLYESARQAAAFEQSLLDELQVDFREVQEIPAMAEAMVHLSHAEEHLKQIETAGWKSPADHPDLEPAHEALMISELYAEMLRNEEVARQPEDFREWLQDSQAAAQELEAELNAWSATEHSTDPPARLTQLAGRISANCKSCHQKYRDVPLSEK